jgi:pyruvate dehydrogenase E2 component (dihydrolipoamide acetyltransferase)
MAHEVVMPRLGWTMEQGTLVEWLKHDGDNVQVGDIVFTVESDKALNEVEALEAGILRIPPDSPSLGSVLPIGALLAYIVQPGEAAPFEHSRGATLSPVFAVQEMASVQPSASVKAALSVARHSTPSISPRARRIATELGVRWEDLRGSGRTGRIVERDVRAAISAVQGTPLRVTPLARRVADDLAVDLQQVAGAQPGKRITRADVEAASLSVAQPASPPAGALPAGDDWTPISSVRRITGERMMAGVHTTAPVTLTSEVDATELVRLRKQIAADATSGARLVPSYTDLLVRLCAVALTEHPVVNARFQNDGIVHSKAVHIGIAVDTDRGLLVPVIRDTHSRSVRNIAAESAALIERARAGQLSPDEMRGGTFTITNLGMFGVDAFTPILNLPECAILGVGRIVPKQVVVDADAERLAIRHMVVLSLTFDHRLIDGAQAARFLYRIRQYVEQPYLWVI